VIISRTATFTDPRIDPLRFGRRRVTREAAPVAASAALGSDLKLFASTFAAGFVFVSVFLA
jgi:hypothetical protein